MMRTTISTPRATLLTVALGGMLLAACEKPPSPAAPPTLDRLAGMVAEGEPPPRAPDAPEVARGLAVYTRHCLECHGERGVGPAGDWRVRDADGHYPPPPLDDSAHAWHHPTAVLLEMIRDGSPGGEGKMPAWRHKLSEPEMQDVVAYIKSLWSDDVYRLWWKMERQSLEP
ncbi:MAG: c-type cytochrome [Gammaproteobacteria bacterium]